MGDGAGVDVRGEVSDGVFVPECVGVAIGVNVGVGDMGAIAVEEIKSASTFEVMWKSLPDSTIRLITIKRRTAQKARLVAFKR